MLIAVSTKKPDLSSELSEAFGRSRYFMIYDSIKNTSEFMLNPFSSELGGAGIQSARFLIEKNIEAIITTFIGLHTLRFINSLNIKVYNGSNLKTYEAIQWFTENKLAEITCNKVEQYPERKRKRYRTRFKKFK
jgi:predicted Fe-Mo cluster-binding NifX family protein